MITENDKFVARTVINALQGSCPSPMQAIALLDPLVSYAEDSGMMFGILSILVQAGGQSQSAEEYGAFCSSFESITARFMAKDSNAASLALTKIQKQDSEWGFEPAKRPPRTVIKSPPPYLRHWING